MDLEEITEVLVQNGEEIEVARIENVQKFVYEVLEGYAGILAATIHEYSKVAIELAKKIYDLKKEDETNGSETETQSEGEE